MYSAARLQGRALEHGLVAAIAAKSPPSDIRMLRHSDDGKTVVDFIRAPALLERMTSIARHLLQSVQEKVRDCLGWRFAQGHAYADQHIRTEGVSTSIDLRVAVDARLSKGGLFGWAGRQLGFLSPDYDWVEVKWSTSSSGAQLHRDSASSAILAMQQIAQKENNLLLLPGGKTKKLERPQRVCRSLRCV